MRRGVVIARTAPETVEKLAAPATDRSAGAVARAIPAHVPVNTGHSKSLFSRLRVDRQEDGSARVAGFPPHWHWFEYGTRWNPPYRPIENAVRSLGLTWDSKPK